MWDVIVLIPDHYLSIFTSGNNGPCSSRWRCCLKMLADRRKDDGLLPIL